MNQTVKSVLFFVSGVAVGAGGMYAGMAGYFRKKNADDLKAMSDYIDKTYRGKKDPLYTVKEVHLKEDSPLANSPIAQKIMNSPSPHAQNAEKELIDSYRETLQTRTSYNNLASPSPATVMEDAPEEDEERPPYVITPEEWADPEPYYEKKSIAYEIGSGILVDLLTGEELDIDISIGLNCFNILNQLNPGAYIFIRNDQLSTDYEIEIREIEEEDYEV